MIDKNYCMSSYLALRYIERDDCDFFDGMHHQNIKPIPDSQKILVDSADEIDSAIQKNLEKLRGKNLGILLSGGMDSGNLASYLPPGSKAYTFRFIGGNFQEEELNRAKKFAETYELDLKFVEIDWDVANSNLDLIMERKSAPVHSIEPQIYAAAMQAKSDGVDCMLIGESADLIFGGMDQLLSKNWTIEDFQKRYTFLEPSLALKNPVDLSYVFERYRLTDDRIDFLKFMDEIFSIESSSSYLNAFTVAGMQYFDPYANLKMKSPLDLHRVRNGEPKYLIRALFAKKYPEIPIPNKVPMPRPVDFYFENWSGVTRPEFRDDIDLSKLTGNQKWQLYCLERFLDRFEVRA